MKFALRGQTRNFRFTFTDQTGAKIVPDTKEAEVYDPKNVKVVTIPGSEFVEVEPGVYDVAYTPATDALLGRWEIVGKGTKNSSVARDPQAFKVTDFYVPEVDEVRQTLGNLSIKLIPDETIGSMINLAFVKVQQNASGAASQDLKEETTLSWACFLTYQAYVAVLDRGPGVTATAATVLESLRALAEEFLEYTKRGAPTYTPIVEQWKTLLDLFRDGTITEDYY